MIGRPMRDLLRAFIRNEAGASAAEYALILAVIGGAVAAAATNLGVGISTAITTSQGNL